MFFAAHLVILSSSVLAFNQTTAKVPLAVSLPPLPPPSVTAGVFPIDQVRRGLHGVAYTVFEGTQPEPMSVEILGVLHNYLGPGQDLILSRLTGAKPEYTGVVAGMSGSPVYIDGKLLGALSYRIGVFSKEPIAGITPIQQMLQVRDQRSITPAVPSEPLGRPAAVSEGGTAQTASVPASDVPDMQPIETPLVFSGFSPEAIKLWQDHLPASGLTAVSVVGGATSNQPQPEPLIPGSAVSAILVRGDLDIAATCTVTYIDPKQLLACGHPITQFGPVSMPMTKAEVLATLPSPLNAFKIINTTETVGAFTQDRQSAIGGQLGASARMIPVTVNIAGAGQADKAARALHFEVVDNPGITPVAVLVSIYQALLANNSYAEETTYRIRAAIDLDGYPTVRIDSAFAPSEQIPAPLLAAFTVYQHFSQIYGNAARLTNIRSVAIDFEAIPGRQSLQIESARSSATEVHAGDTITVEATVRPWHGEARNLRIPVAVPPTLSAGPLRLVVSDAATLDRLTLAARPGAPALDMADTIAQINSLHSSERLYVTLLEPSPQANLSGRTLSALPISMANIFEPLRTNQSVALNGESAVPAGSVPAGGVVNGQQIISLQVE
jgi:hypothetical protein